MKSLNKQSLISAALLNSQAATICKYRTFVLVLFLYLTIASCSSDDEGPVPVITTQATTATFDDLNGCDINDGGPFATLFDFTIPYNTTAPVEIDRITTDWEWETGNSGTNQETSFNDTGAAIIYDWCWRFGDDNWVDLTSRLVTKEGIISSSSSIRLTKPDDAN